MERNDLGGSRVIKIEHRSNDAILLHPQTRSVHADGRRGVASRVEAECHGIIMKVHGCRCIVVALRDIDAMLSARRTLDFVRSDSRLVILHPCPLAPQNAASTITLA